MMKEEFEDIIGREVDDDEYKIIEYVYTHHPLVATKDDAAEIYNHFGVAIFHSLVPSALQFEAAYRKWQAANNHAESLKAEWQIAQEEADALHDKYRAMTDALKIGYKPGK